MDSIAHVSSFQSRLRSLYDLWFGLYMQSARRGQISYSRGSESSTRKLIYTMGILYGQIPTWLTEQAVNSSRRYVSATSVRRVLSQALVETTIL